MMLLELNCGDWFTTKGGGHYMKVEPIEGGEATFYAICLESGRPSLAGRPGHPALEMEVIPRAKPPEWRHHGDY